MSPKLKQAIWKKCCTLKYTALQYRKTLSNCIKGEQLKTYMITEILDCINGIYESNLNEGENLFLLNDLCTL